MARIEYGGLNVGSGIGTIVPGAMGPSASTAEDTPARDVLGPDTEAGQALLVALIGLAVLWVAVGPGEGGPIARAQRVLQNVVLVAAAMWVVGFTTRTYAVLHPDWPLAMGLAWDS